MSDSFDLFSSNQSPIDGIIPLKAMITGKSRHAATAIASCLPVQTASMLLSRRAGLGLLSVAGSGDTVLVGQLLLFR